MTVKTRTKRAGVDIKRASKAKDALKKGDLYTLEAGQTLVYVHPPCREDDEHELTAGLPCVPIGIHYAVGKKNGMVVSFDRDSNPILTHPFVLDVLKKRKIRLPKRCPVKEAIDGEMSDGEAEDARLQSKFIWGITPMAHRSKAGRSWSELDAIPSIAIWGTMIHEGLLTLFEEQEVDITDPDAAIFAIIDKTGVKKATRYEVRVDKDTAKTPKKFSKAERAALYKALDNDCDLFRFVGNFMKSPAEAEALLAGVATKSDGDEPDDEDELDEPPKRRAKAKGKRRREPEPEEDDEEDEDEDEEEEEEEPPRRKKASRRRKPEPEDEDEEEEEEEDEPPRRKKTSRRRKPEPAEDEEEEDDEEDEDEPPPSRRKKKAKKKAAKKTSRKPEPEEDDEEDDEDDLGLDELDDELEAEEDDEDEEPPPPRRKKKARRK